MKVKLIRRKPGSYFPPTISLRLYKYYYVAWTALTDNITCQHHSGYKWQTYKHYKKLVVFQLSCESSIMKLAWLLILINRSVGSVVFWNLSVGLECKRKLPEEEFCGGL